MDSAGASSLHAFWSLAQCTSPFVPMFAAVFVDEQWHGKIMLRHCCICRATKKQGGSTKNKKDSLPKYLGTKMSDGQLAFPGQVLVTQRGTKFHPGRNVGVVSALCHQCGGSSIEANIDKQAGCIMPDSLPALGV